MAKVWDPFESLWILSTRSLQPAINDVALRIGICHCKNGGEAARLHGRDQLVHLFFYTPSITSNRVISDKSDRLLQTDSELLFDLSPRHQRCAVNLIKSRRPEVKHAFR